MALTCRNCGSTADIEMVDLGMSPLCQDFLSEDRINTSETFYPLRVMVCGTCYLAQLDEFASPDEIFSEYAYFSSYSDSWLDHCRRYAGDMIDRFQLTPTSRVVEVASNDGYLLRWFSERGVPVLGIEPAANVAEVARSEGIETVVEFFGRAVGEDLSSQGVQADLMVGNNVLAQVPDLHDFVSGFPLVLAPEGVLTLEFPHLLRLLDENQFDTIYHEHFSYFSLRTCQDIFGRHGLEIFDVEKLSTHGGSLRLFLHHAGDETHEVTDRVAQLLAEETEGGLLEPAMYQAFGERAAAVKRDLLSVLIAMKDRGESVAAYGAAGKGNTLLNYCGIGTDFIDFVADRNPYKIGRFTPGTHIPVIDPSGIDERQPDHILILPWNLRNEIAQQLEHIRGWGADFIVPIPEVQVFSPGAG
jgi:SAM-dependent methyltransferase